MRLGTHYNVWLIFMVLVSNFSLSFSDSPLLILLTLGVLQYSLHDFNCLNLIFLDLRQTAFFGWEYSRIGMNWKIVLSKTDLGNRRSNRTLYQYTANFVLTLYLPSIYTGNWRLAVYKYITDIYINNSFTKKWNDKIFWCLLLNDTFVENFLYYYYFGMFYLGCVPSAIALASCKYPGTY